MKLLNGSFTGKNLQVGANASQLMEISISAMNASALSITVSDIGKVVASQSTKSGTAASITELVSVIDVALNKVSTQRSALGAIQNRLEHTIANADNVAENTQASESRIRDVDMAEEMVKFSKNNILQQAGQSMLAQANQATQGVLSLL
jgi:flagellin